jgi:hypothetical protein
LGGQDQDDVEWVPTQGDDPPFIAYTSEERKLRVNLRCIKSGPDSLEVYGYDLATQFYTMTLSSKCACWNGCKYIL